MHALTLEAENETNYFNLPTSDDTWIRSGSPSAPLQQIEIPKNQNLQAIKMLTILRKAQLKDKEMRVLMLGLDNAGKTTIVKHIMKEDVNTVSPTLGFIIKTIDYKG